MLHDYSKAYKYCKRSNFLRINAHPRNIFNQNLLFSPGLRAEQQLSEGVLPIDQTEDGRWVRRRCTHLILTFRRSFSAQTYEDEGQEDAELEDDEGGEEDGYEDEYDNYRWQDEASDLSSPKSTTSSKNYESGDEVEDMPESEARPHKSGGSTTESYSSVLQEMEDEDCDNGDILKDLLTDIANGNHVMLSPDSESFTTSEQLTQRFVDIYITDDNCGGVDEGE